MALEKRLAAISAQSFTADGTDRGVIKLTSTYFECLRPFKVKQKVVIKATGETNLELEIKRILQDEVTLEVGPRTGSIAKRTDLTLYTVAKTATIQAEEQNRPNIPFEEYQRAVYEEEPVSATRTFGVDRWGRPWCTDNPFPVQLSDGEINIGTVNAELEVQLNHKDNDPDAGDVHDSIRIGDGVEIVEVNPDGSINVKVVGGGLGQAGDTINTFGEISSVPTNTQTDIVTYTVPVGKTAFFARAEFSGSNVATYEIVVDGVIESRRRTYHGADLTGDVIFDAAGQGGLEVATGKVIKIRVEHGRPMVGDFDGRIQVVEV